MPEQRSVAYFSMEIALEAAMPTYSGGLGVLAGDTLRSAADMGVSMVAVTLLHRKGYFFQRLNEAGQQREEAVEWPVDDFTEELPTRAAVTVDGRKVLLRAWRYVVQGVDGATIPVILLDSDLPENEAWDRRLTDQLYGGDQYYRLCQEIILGIGGVRMLRTLGYTTIARFHMNEGHASLLALELLEEQKKAAARENFTQEDVDAVRKMCIFTTHTPVEAGHDKFPLDMATRVIGLTEDFFELEQVFCCDSVLNMTYLALNLSHYVNGVAKRHREVSSRMFTGRKIDAITNGVHASNWVCPSFRALFDKYIAGWRQDNFSLRGAMSIPREEVWAAHSAAKRQLVRYANQLVNAGLDADHFTLGFARRAAPYKRGALALSDPARLIAIAERCGPIQFIYAGKAHPGDGMGKSIIERIFQAREALRGKITVVYLPNYDAEIAKTLTAGVDLWLNTPQPPLEASGTSGMKAAFNGIPSLSVLDGWWVEGWIEGVTGWSIGGDVVLDAPGTDRWASDAESYHAKLEQQVLPMYYGNRNAYIDMMRQCIALNGAFFNTQRMVQEYVLKAYFP